MFNFICALCAVFFFARLFALTPSVAQGKVGKSGKVGGFNFLPVLFVVCIFAVLTACGGGGGGNSASAMPPATQYTEEPARVSLVTTVADGAIELWDIQTYVRFQGNRIGQYGGALRNIYIPGGENVITTGTGQQPRRVVAGGVRVHTFEGRDITVDLTRTVYFVEFPNHRCIGRPIMLAIAGSADTPKGYEARCTATNQANATITVTTTIHKTDRNLYPVLWLDSESDDYGAPILRASLSSTVGYYNPYLAFPDQRYRRDDGECESAPFYAVGNCQSENAVDVGNFAAFVSGLDGNGYRQFGVRHRFDGEGWNAAAMVSHAKGAEFLDTWWGRLRFEHSIFDDAMAFAEYESGITSLQQRGVMFADIPISGGRVGFRFADFTASFGRPMHYKGKGKNAAALHWQASKETEFSFRSHNNNAEVLWQWRRRF